MSVNKYNASTGELTNIASGQRTWVGTQAAYKSAKQAGTLPNNAIIAITDDEVDHNHYSTEETETGMYWIDGKPIYRKVFTIDTQTRIEGSRDLGEISNADKLINATGIGDDRTSSGSIMMLPNAVFSINSSNHFIISSMTGTFMKWYFIAEYTKTTD